MKSFTLRICVFALAAVLFNWQPVLAGCGELCDGNNCNTVINHPEWGCIRSGTVCLDAWCSPSAAFDQELLAKIEKAVLAGDTHTVALLATAAGQPFRLHSKDGVVYDGFALAGLTGPGPNASSAETQVALAACRGAADPSSSAAEETAETAAVVTQER